MSDLLSTLQWWLVFFAIGMAFLPLTFTIFTNFFDRGYIFSKILGMALITYIVFILCTLHVLPFTNITIFITVGALAMVNPLIFRKNFINIKKYLGIFLLEETLFLTGLFFWSFIRGFQPDIFGLEKYMDFGFINSILRSTYFPPRDMWYTPFPINYYYFGHLTTATFTKLSGIPANITFNLMLGTIFAFTFTCTFSIGANLINNLKTKISSHKFAVFAGGILTGILTTFAGNLHTIYTLFKPYNYTNENPPPFWQLKFSPLTFPNQYWYPNATRFIYHTIHEFPMYSFVVSDLHGHVLDIPFVLLSIAALLSLLENKRSIISSNILKNLLLIGFLIAIMYMTNAWDGGIYLLLSAIIIFFITPKDNNGNFNIKSLGTRCLIIAVSFYTFSLPFSYFFNTSEIVHGIGVLCAPTFLTNINHFGPFLFEAQHCQKSPWWQLMILYGFFYFWVLVFLLFIFKRNKLNVKHITQNISPSELFISILILLSTFLIIIPEFLYLKDIYPEHYRANTMFKLVYQSFIMLSIVSGYSIVRLILSTKFKILKLIFIFFGGILVILVMIYPYFAITSYYNNLQLYKGLDGTKYLQQSHPTDYEAINWINANIKGQPVILEAQGDSYTEYARVSANTGLPTVLGWTVHEWLWRGSYDPLPARINDIKLLYETSDIQTAEQIIKKYNISLVFVGDLERKKYTGLNENKFLELGKIIYKNSGTTIYKLNS